jgi:hypothetical protein
MQQRPFRHVERGCPVAITDQSVAQVTRSLKSKKYVPDAVCNFPATEVKRAQDIRTSPTAAGCSTGMGIWRIYDKLRS